MNSKRKDFDGETSTPFLSNHENENQDLKRQRIQEEAELKGQLEAQQPNFDEMDEGDFYAEEPEDLHTYEADLESEMDNQQEEPKSKQIPDRIRVIQPPSPVPEMDDDIFDSIQEYVIEKVISTHSSRFPSRYPPMDPNDEFVTCTNMDGTLWYILLDRDNSQNGTGKNTRPLTFANLKRGSRPISSSSQSQENTNLNIEDLDRPIEDKLWVDKYAPRVFTDLVTSDKANRDIMRWIKTYDTTKKILLLVGSAGIGKTSLANVIANQAGYQPRSINASDDRAQSTLVDKIVAITQNQSVFGDKKPPLLILDEVDGIAGNEANSAIKTLLKLSLSTPVICICNDQYAPVLRPLRMSAQVFVFYKSDININRVEKRIKEICKLERIEIANHMISSLVKQAEGDIRSCLNTLQFSNKKRGKITELIIQKDAKSHYFDIMGTIFSDKELIPIGDMEEKVIQGCFQCYPLQRYSDIDLKKTNSVLDQLAFCDQIQKSVYSNGAFSLFWYLHNAVLSFHLNCKTMYQPKIEFPKTEGENKAKLKRSLNIVKSFVNGIHPNVKTCVSSSSVAVEFLPYFVQLINPVIKNLADPNQKKRLVHIAQLDKTYGIEYKSSYTQGVQNIHLEPEIDILSQFGSNSHRLDQVMGRELQSILWREKNPLPEAKKRAPLPEMKRSIELLPNYKFHEGHNAGIKRQAKMKEFL